jgi:hypothetical protein
MDAYLSKSMRGVDTVFLEQWTWLAGKQYIIHIMSALEDSSVSEYCRSNHLYGY